MMLEPLSLDVAGCGQNFFFAESTHRLERYSTPRSRCCFVLSIVIYRLFHGTFRFLMMYIWLRT